MIKKLYQIWLKIFNNLKLKIYKKNDTNCKIIIYMNYKLNHNWIIEKILQSNISILNINKIKEQEIITSNLKIYKINKLKRSLLMLDLLEEKRRRKKRKWKKEYN